MIAGPVVNTDNSCTFSVWAPEKKQVFLHIVHPFDRELMMRKNDEGYFSVTVDEVHDGCRYFIRTGKQDLPDPGSHYQPGGVHGPSQVVDHSIFNWTDLDWKSIPVRELVFYEVHTGTFTTEGTFEAMIPLLPEIRNTGFNAIELMPVAQFPGSRNWGYDGVYPYSVQNSYGGPEGLKKLVNACHSEGIAVFLDVVYNHLGPEGNYFSSFGPYFTSKYRIPWGDAINLDDAWSDGVRDYFSDNPAFWFRNYHIDGIRADAIHMIFDSGAVNFWELTKGKVEKEEERQGRKFCLIAEADYNSPRVISPAGSGGYGFDALWLDDFHHALYVLLHREGRSRYEDFGALEQLAKAYTDGFVHSGEMVRFRKKRHGASSAGLPGDRFVVFNQNHDQVGNRVGGERLPSLVGYDQVRQASAAIILSPYIPLFFMGEEYGEDNPFFYFVSHSDEELVNSVREGRKKEFESFKWETEPPDPQDEYTFKQSGIDWNKRYSGKHLAILEWNRTLLELRRNHQSLRNFSKDGVFVYLFGQEGFGLLRKSSDEKEMILCIFNISEREIPIEMPAIAERWKKLIDSNDDKWREETVNEAEGTSAPAEIKASDMLTCHVGSTLVYCSLKQMYHT
jgi:maltooligosyltrehalose trehalohydrolase